MHSVVGGVVSCRHVIYGARIHRTVALRMRLQMYIIEEFIHLLKCKKFYSMYKYVNDAGSGDQFFLRVR